MSADGKVVIQTELDTKKADKQAKNLGSSLKSGIAKGAKATAGALATVATATTATAGAMVKATKATMEYGVEVNRNSQKLNMSKQGYQEWSYVLKRSGTSIDSLRMGMKKISTAIDEAKNGSKSATENFKRLGLSVDDLKGKSQEEVFGMMVQRLQGIKDTTERSAIANKFFGRSAQEMAGLLNKSGKDVEALKKQAHDLGLVLSDDAIKKSAEFRGKITELQSAFEGLRNKMAVKFLPSLTQVTEGMSLLVQGKETDGLKKIENGIKGFSDTLLKTVPTLLKVAGGLVLSLSQAIVNNLPQLISTGTQIVVSLVQGVAKMLPMAVTMIFKSLEVLINNISKQLPTLVNTIISSLISALNTFVSNVPNLVQLATTLVNSLIDAVLIVIQNIPNLIQVAISLINSLVSAILEAIPTLIERLPEIIGSVISAIISSIPMIISGLIRLVANIITRLPEIILGIIEAIPKMISQFLTALTDVDKITQWVKGLISMCIKIAQETPKMVAEFVKKIPSMIKQFVTGMIDKVGEWVSGLKSLVKKIIENMPNIIHAFVEWVKDLPARIVAWLSSLPERSNELGKKAFKFLYNGFVWMLNHSVDVTQHIIKWIQGGGPSRFAKRMQDLGVDIIKGIVAGALKASEECDKIGLMILKKVKDYFIIGSPSKLMKKEVGYWIGVGTADGIVDGFMKENPMSQINNAMASEIQASAGKLQSAINASIDLNNNIQGLAGAVVEGIANSNLTVKIGEREMGRVVRSY